MTERTADDRLESWKEIAAYLRRDITTVQRWERREGMPVHRHLHDKAGSVHAFKSELDAWAASRKAPPAPPEAPAPGVPEDPPVHSGRSPRRKWPLAAALLAGVVLLGVLFLPRGAGDPLEGARFVQLTNFDGIEHAAALSRDGRFVAFVSDRDGRPDVWVTQVGGSQFYNLTRGAEQELVNPDVRTLGFTPDGTLVTFWTRSTGDHGSAIGIRAAPVLGGAARSYLEGVAEFDWSADGTRLVYHTPAPGDPMFVRDAGQEPRQIFSAPAGLHAHFPRWSPDGDFIYFVQGSVPDRMDIWRVRPDGSEPEQMTNHGSRVSHPVFVDARTLLYLATDGDGTGPWIHALDVRRRQHRRVSPGLERYTSLEASAGGETLAASRAQTKTILWRLPLGEAAADTPAASRIVLPTGSGRSARFGPDYLVYVAAAPDGDRLWKLQGESAAELWSSPGARILGAPAVARDGRRIAFCTQDGTQSSLVIINADGTSPRVVTRSLALHGSPAWGPDGESITVAALVDGSPRLWVVRLEGSEPTRLVDEYATDPAWTPDGELVVYSGADVGTMFPVKGRFREREGRFLELMVSRGSRRLAFRGRRSLLLLRGDIGHKNLWLLDLETGAERQLTTYPADFRLHDFDVSPDGRELVIERLQEESDIVLIQRGK